MTKGGSKKMKIKIKVDTGEVDRIIDENNNDATEMTPQEIQQMYQAQTYRYDTSNAFESKMHGLLFRRQVLQNLSLGLALN